MNENIDVSSPVPLPLDQQDLASASPWQPTVSAPEPVDVFPGGAEVPRGKLPSGLAGTGPPVALARNKCAICQADDGGSRFRVSGCTIVRCRQCGMVYTELRPLSGTALYDESYYHSGNPKGGYANYFAGARINQLTFARRLRALERRTGRRGRILDIGCALGDFLAVARAGGWETYGVEVSPWAGEIARRQGHYVHTGPIESAGFADGFFDAITLYDVIEHAVDPLGLLHEVHRVLSGQGLVHLVTPNVGGALAAIFGSRWYHYKPGEHIYYFSRATLTRLLRAAGFRVEGCSVTGSVMTPAYVLDRLQYYSRPVAKLALAAARRFRIDQIPLYLLTGEMQAWARRPAWT